MERTTTRVFVGLVLTLTALVDSADAVNCYHCWVYGSGDCTSMFESTEQVPCIVCSTVHVYSPSKSLVFCRK